MEPERYEDIVDATRRTRLASERTYLAWWRSALAAFAVSLGVGKLIPELTSGQSIGYEIVGVGTRSSGSRSSATATGASRCSRGRSSRVASSRSADRGARLHDRGCRARARHARRDRRLTPTPRLYTHRGYTVASLGKGPVGGRHSREGAGPPRSRGNDLRLLRLPHRAEPERAGRRRGDGQPRHRPGSGAL